MKSGIPPVSHCCMPRRALLPTRLRLIFLVLLAVGMVVLVRALTRSRPKRAQGLKLALGGVRQRVARLPRGRVLPPAGRVRLVRLLARMQPREDQAAGGEHVQQSRGREIGGDDPAGKPVLFFKA